MRRSSPAFLSCLLSSVCAGAHESDLLGPPAGGLTVDPPPQESSAPQYEVHEIGSSAWGLTIPNDINNRGLIVGEWDSGPDFGDPRHAVAWIDGVMVDLTPDAAVVFASARSVNDRGVISGYYKTDGTYSSAGFIWHEGILEILPTFAEGHQKGLGISEGGLILGSAMHEHFKTTATMWNRRLHDHDLGALGFGTGIAYDANGWDAIVGSSGTVSGQAHAFLWRSGKLRDIGVLPGYPISRAYAINNHNEAVGYSGRALDDHAVYWSESTGMLDLGNLGHPLGASAKDINDSGVIVGYSSTANSRLGVVWHDFVLYDLNKLLVNGQGWEISDANGINELGQIVGMGRRNGKSVGYVLTPVGEPMATLIGPTPGVAGKVNEIELVAASPGAQVRLLYGPESGSSKIPECPGVVVDIAHPRSVDVIAGAEGNATVSIHIPKGVKGGRLLFQAVDLSNCDVTNLIVRTID